MHGSEREDWGSLQQVKWVREKGLNCFPVFCAVRGHASFCLFVRLWCETIKIWGGIEGKVRNKKEEVGAEEEKKKLGEENKSLDFFLIHQNCTYCEKLHINSKTLITTNNLANNPLNKIPNKITWIKPNNKPR